MAKIRTKFVCSNCGAEFPRWLGRCSACGAWNTLEEQVERKVPAGSVPLPVGGEARGPVALSDVEMGAEERLLLHMPEVDRPLGGGMVRGSVILLGGEPGIGKSTLVFQICRAVCAASEKVLYASGEESEMQIKMRADRLGISGQSCYVMSGVDLARIIDAAKEVRPAVLVIDSIQTMYLADTASPMGSPGQIRDSTALLVRLAKECHMTVLIVGHVTKEGNLAGPRILEHMVDVVLYLEGDRSFQFRVLRPVKNRFGSTSETGLFVMERGGLAGIADPSGYLLRTRETDTAGSIAVAALEGQRAILVEIQALSVHSVLSVPRRISVGYDYNRLIILLAVLEKRAKIPFSNEDVYVNVAGGFKVRETAADLAAALSVVSVKWEVPIPGRTAALGEVALTGDVLPVSHIGLRLKEAVKMKLDHFILPRGNQKEAEAFFRTIPTEGIFVSYVSRIGEAVALLRGR